MNQKQRIKLRKFMNELGSIRGRHTELVSVYVPEGYDLIKVIQHLEQEKGTATNIKDARTRKNVIDSLERAIRHLRLYKRTPENGLAVFAGNASDNESKIDIKVWSIEPPEPIRTRLYRCDQNFVIDILKDMMDTNNVYGLVVMDAREATLGLLKGSSITEITTLTSGVPGKVKAGGQSAARYARLRENAVKEFFSRIGEALNKNFLEMKELKGIILGGPIPTKDEFYESKYLNNELKKKVIGLKDLSYTGDFGLQEIVDKAQDLLAQEESAKEKLLLQRFFETLGKDRKKVAYGKEGVDKVIDLGAVEVLILTEDLEDKEIEDYEEKASNVGTDVFVVSIESREGKQLKDLGGIAAILRYAVE
ncbi:MAG: peptide chain release factor aRF-1 [Candidatus Nanoarchaeia archaeon]|jgi:peptide chain release factor subunit 1|nr:peptide chain release factor aRF-1 [Candidatus Nanoarchaeia archaeon]